MEGKRVESSYRRPDSTSTMFYNKMPRLKHIPLKFGCNAKKIVIPNLILIEWKIKNVDQIEGPIPTN